MPGYRKDEPPMRASLFNLIAAIWAPVSCLFALGVAAKSDSVWFSGIGVYLLTAVGGAVVGLLLSVIALVRNERRYWLTALAFTLCLLAPAFPILWARLYR
jgi:membrane associated rhomboid family serine protease